MLHFGIEFLGKIKEGFTLFIMKNFFYENLFLAKAMPEPDLRYLSNSKAFFSDKKAQYQTSLYGLFFFV